jgi:hypothetical protein
MINLRIVNAELDAEIVRKEEAAADGAAILNDVCAFIGRFVAYPSEHAQFAHFLWIAHTHLKDSWESTPRIAFLSPEPGSGKTRALEVSALLVPNAVETVNMSSAYLFRRIGMEDALPTVLMDEIDAFFTPKSAAAEEIRGLLNAGHRRGAVVGRCVTVGKAIETVESPAFCAVALAGLGWLPDTLMSRSVVIRMRRRAPTETVEPFRPRLHRSEGEALKERLSSWATSIAGETSTAMPEMPPGVEDRAADCWEALLGVADAAGGHWPDTSRAAAVALVTAAREANPSLGIRLLEDLRTVFNGPDTALEREIATDRILSLLCALPESPWGDMKGRPLDDRKLARMLGRYEIKPKVLKSVNRRGYRRDDLVDVWSRYLPVPSPQEA